MEGFLIDGDITWTTDLQPSVCSHGFCRYGSYSTNNAFAVAVEKLVNIEPGGNTKMMLMVTGILLMTGSDSLGKYTPT